MAYNSRASSTLVEIINRYYPKKSLDTLSATPTVVQASNAVYPQVTYSENEETQIVAEQARADSITSLSNEDLQQEPLSSLNNHLSTRTTLLGSKPSIADAVLYLRLVPLVKSWSQEKKTGPQGYHHIVRYVDFVQNSPDIGLSISENEKVSVNPSDVLFVPRPPDAKEEKERRKKEKVGMPGSVTEGLLSGQAKLSERSKSTKSLGKDSQQIAQSSAKAGIAEETAPTKEKKAKQLKPQKQPAKDVPLSPSLIDLRVGHIIKAVTHPNADSLFVSTIAVGDAPGTEHTSEYEGQIVRTVCSGLNGLIPLEEMQDRKIIAVCNLKPVTMRGIKSAAMVLAASPRLAEGEADSHAGPVELVAPPEGATAGQRVFFEGWEGEPEGVLNPKKKVWDSCQVAFTTSENLEVVFEKDKVEQLKGDAGVGKPERGRLMVKDVGACRVKTLKGAVVR